MTDKSNKQNNMTKKQLALIVAGGTGGHVFPGLSIAEKLQENGWSVKWIGTEEGMEAQLVRSRHLDFEPVSIVGLRGKGPLRFILLPFIVLRAFYQSFKIIRRTKPDLIIGMGGYVGFAPPMIGSLLNVPIVIHEQNAVPGLVNKVVSAIADLRFSAFPDTLAGAECCGNPVLKNMLSVDSPENRFASRSGPLKILVVGGSRGARWLNQSLPKLFSLFPEDKKIEIIHQAGANLVAELEKEYASHNIEATVTPFIENMSQAYADADLVISRSGAMTVTELACVGVASILIPFPYAVDDHQYVNAKYLADHQAAYLLRQADIVEEEMVDLLTRLSRQDCLDMAIKARTLCPGDAAAKIVAACEAHIERKKS